MNKIAYRVLDYQEQEALGLNNEWTWVMGPESEDEPVFGLPSMERRSLHTIVALLNEQYEKIQSLQHTIDSDYWPQA